MFIACEFRAPLWFWDVKTVDTLVLAEPEALPRFHLLRVQGAALVLGRKDGTDVALARARGIAPSSTDCEFRAPL